MKNRARSLFLYLFLAGMLMNCRSANAQVTGLSFRPVDAAYSLALDKIILISGSPSQLHIYDPVSQADITVALPAAPQNVCLSPDGIHAGVASSNEVDYVDLQGATVTNLLEHCRRRGKSHLWLRLYLCRSELRRFYHFDRHCDREYHDSKC